MILSGDLSDFRTVIFNHSFCTAAQGEEMVPEKCLILDENYAGSGLPQAPFSREQGNRALVIVL